MVGSTAHAPSRAGDRPGRGLEQGSPTPDAFSELGRPVLLLGGAQLPGLLAGQAAAESRARGPRGGLPRRLSTLSRLSNNFPARVLQESKNHCPMPNTLLTQCLWALGVPPPPRGHI